MRIADIPLAPLAATLGAAAAILLMPSVARSQAPSCGPFADLKKFLAEKHKEVEVGGGIVNQNAAMIVFASPDGTTWTLAAVGTDGKACIVSSGTGWAQGRVPNSKERQS